MSKKRTIQLLLFFILIPLLGNSQYLSTKVMSKHEMYKDSLKNVKYDYIFSVWRQKSYEKGFDIPYSAGIMSNFFWTEQGITIDNFQLGLKTDNKDIPLTSTDFIGFWESKTTPYFINVRPDLWIFPFLNVYGIFGYRHSRTGININRLDQKPFELQSVVQQGTPTTGVRIMGVVGFSVDANWTWNKPKLLDKSTKLNVLEIRIGHSFVFKNQPQNNIAVWIESMRTKMSSETTGEIRLGDALLNLEDKVDEADGSVIFRYGMNKQVKQLWNCLLEHSIRSIKNG